MGNNGDVLADSIFCTFPGCRAPWQWGGPGASQVPWVLSGICCGLILTGGVNILPGWREDKPSDGSGWRLVKLMAQVATPHRAFSFWPAIILIQNNFKALFITRDWPDLISVPHQGHLLVVIAFYFFFSQRQAGWALHTLANAVYWCFSCVISYLPSETSQNQCSSYLGREWQYLSVLCMAIGLKWRTWLNKDKILSIVKVFCGGPELEVLCDLCQRQVMLRRLAGGWLLKTSPNFSPLLGDLQLFYLAVAAEILLTIKRAALPQ